MSTPHIVAPLQGITCHAWNHDRSMVAVCPNNNTVVIYKAPKMDDPKAKWEILHLLKEHDQVVTGIDWAPTTNRIVTASQDRNAYVWNLENNEWKPTLVILRVNRAATQVKWTKDEKKFAVGSGARCVPVCYYEEENNWWVSKIIKKHKSTVLALDWHPSMPLLATASSDFKCRIFSAYVKGCDSKSSCQGNPFDVDNTGKMGFGDVLFETGSAGWVHSVQWSPSGAKLAFCGHDSSVSVISVTGPDSPVQTIKLPTLPFRALQFLNETALVAAGYELNPTIFADQGGEWVIKGRLDKGRKKEEVKQSQAKAAFAMFQSQAKKAASGAEDTMLSTSHQNSISCIAPISGGGDVTAFTTTGLDGILTHWQIGSIESAMANLSI